MPVLVDESGAGGVTLDRLVFANRDDVGIVVGCSLLDSAMGSMTVVVLDVFFVEYSELALVPDDGSVEEFVAKCPHPSFSEGVGLR